MSESNRAAGHEDVKSSAAVIKHPRASMEMGTRGFDFTLDGAIRFAQGLIDSGMVPKGIKGPGAVVGLIEAGKELGLAPMYALANLTFTNGRLGIMGDAAKALIRRSGTLKAGTDFIETYEGEEFTAAWKCTVAAWREGQSEPFSRSFSIGEAVAAKLIKLDGKKVLSRAYEGFNDNGPWSTYTKRMLMYRALGFLARDYFSDVLGGAVLAEELRDYPQETHEPAAAPPAEPDPLFTAAVATHTPADAVEAEVVPVEASQPARAEPEQSSSNPRAEIPADEQKLTKEVERFEGQLTGAESAKDLEAAWLVATALLKRASDTERQRLQKLYKQLAKNFEK